MCLRNLSDHKRECRATVRVHPRQWRAPGRQMKIGSCVRRVSPRLVYRGRCDAVRAHERLCLNLQMLTLLPLRCTRVDGSQDRTWVRKPGTEDRQV